MTLQQLKYVLEVANKGSMNEAAKSLFISQPSLSNAIKELEKELQIQIFIRTNKGIVLSNEGLEFLGYASQVLEQYGLLEEKYLGKRSSKISFSVSTQHYAFAVNAFIDLVKEYGYDEYNFSIQETRTYEIIEDVKKQKSEIGILYLNDFNADILKKLLKESRLEFHELFKAEPHVFIGKDHPLAHKKSINIEELDAYPFLSFEQGENNSFYFQEEILSTYNHKKSIKVSDRATLFNLLLGLDGYTISTGIITQELNPHIITIPLNVHDYFQVGYITLKSSYLSEIAKVYIEKLNIFTNNLL